MFQHQNPNSIFNGLKNFFAKLFFNLAPVDNPAKSQRKLISKEEVSNALDFISSMESCTAHAYANFTGLNQHRVKSLFRNLCLHNRLEKLSYGVYRIPQLSQIEKTEVVVEQKTTNQPLLWNELSFLTDMPVETGIVATSQSEIKNIVANPEISFQVIKSQDFRDMIKKEYGDRSFDAHDVCKVFFESSHRSGTRLCDMVKTGTVSRISKGRYELTSRLLNNKTTAKALESLLPDNPVKSTATRFEQTAGRKTLHENIVAPKLLNILQKSPVPITEKDLLKITGHHRTTVRRNILGLRAENRIRQVGTPENRSYVSVLRPLQESSR